MHLTDMERSEYLEHMGWATKIVAGGLLQLGDIDGHRWLGALVVLREGGVRLVLLCGDFYCY